MIHALHTTKKPLQKMFLSSAKVFYNLLMSLNADNLLYMSNLPPPPPPVKDFSSQPREVVRQIALSVFTGGYHLIVFIKRLSPQI